MIKFNKESGCVNIWANLISKNIYNFEQIPNLLNLRECVEKVLQEVNYKSN